MKLYGIILASLYLTGSSMCSAAVAISEAGWMDEEASFLLHQIRMLGKSDHELISSDSMTSSGEEIEDRENTPTSTREVAPTPFTMLGRATPSTFNKLSGSAFSPVKRDKTEEAAQSLKALRLGRSGTKQQLLESAFNAKKAALSASKVMPLHMLLTQASTADKRSANEQVAGLARASKRQAIGFSAQ